MNNRISQQPRRLLFLWASLLSISLANVAIPIFAHGSSIRYLANEGVMVSSTQGKVLFDPFFHNDFGQYQKVPEANRNQLFNQLPPFDGIDFIVISHAHEDHFSPEDVLRYLTLNKRCRLVAPQQAVAILKLEPSFNLVADRVVSVNLQKGQVAFEQRIGEVDFSAVRIPHAGWPGRADIENLIVRVQLGDSSVMHFGDADPAMMHFIEQKPFFARKELDLALPPYWFLTRESGINILNEIIKPSQIIGIHVPVTVPVLLSQSTYDFFSRPGELRLIINKNDNQSVKNNPKKN